jgi:hypothetical protein
MNKLLVTLTVIALVGIPVIPIAKAEQSEPNSLQKLLVGKTYGNIIATQDFSFASDAGDINLQKGKPISDGIPLAIATNLKDFSPASALAAANQNIDLNKVQLGELKFLEKVPLKTLLKVDPSISDIPANSIGWADQGNKTLSEIASAASGNLPLPDAVLKSVSIGEFGNIAKIPYSQFSNITKQPIKNFIGLANIPLNSTLVSSIGLNIRLMRVDKIRYREKDFNSKVVSGSDLRPLAKWDKSDPVTGVELRDAVISDKINLANGSIAIIGASQMLPGGNIPSPLEPTGLDVPGTPFKISFENPDPKTGSVQLQLNMRLEYPFGLRTSHFLPIPTGIAVTERSKTTLIPLEVPLPEKNIASVSRGAGFSVVDEQPEKIAEPEIKNKANQNTEPVTQPQISTQASDLAKNVLSGNVGQAVKTNAFNPSIGIN